MRKRMLGRGKEAKKKREMGARRKYIYASDYYAIDATSESCLS